MRELLNRGEDRWAAAMGPRDRIIREADQPAHSTFGAAWNVIEGQARGSP